MEEVQSGRNVRYLPADITVYNIDVNDDFIFVNTSLNPVRLFLPNIKNAGLDFLPKNFFISDSSGNANTNNIIIYGVDNEINSGQGATITNSYGSAECTIVNPNEWFVLTDSVVGPTVIPDLQQVLTAGSGLTGPNSIYGIGVLEISNTDLISYYNSIAFNTGNVTISSVLNFFNTNTMVLTPTQTTFSRNILTNNIFLNTLNTVSAGGTTILTIDSSAYQVLTGSLSQTYQLPDATTMPISMIFNFNNNSSGSLIIINAVGTTIYTTPPGGVVNVQCTGNSTTAGTWDGHPTAPFTATWGSGITGLVMNSALSTSAKISAGASSSTAPVFIPQRGTPTNGFGGDSTTLYGIIGGVARFSVTSTDFITNRITGGTAASDSVDIFATTGVGTTGGAAVTLRGGTNGGTIILAGLNSGNLRIPNNRQFLGTDSGGVDRAIFTWSSGDNITFTGKPGSTDIVFNPTSSGVGMYVKSNGDVGIGAASPVARCHIIKTTEQLRVGYDTSNYYKTTIGSSGIVTFDAVGAGAKFIFSDNIELTQTVTTEVLTTNTSVSIVINGNPYKLLAKA